MQGRGTLERQGLRTGSNALRQGSNALEWVGPLKTLGSRKILGDPEIDGKAVSVQDPLSHRTVGPGISMSQRSSQTSVADSGCQVCPRTDKFWDQVRGNFYFICSPPNERCWQVRPRFEYFVWRNYCIEQGTWLFCILYSLEMLLSCPEVFVAGS